MKTIGIVVDNYKLEKFKSELEARGYPNYKVLPFLKNTTQIHVEVEDSKFADDTIQIARLCRKMEYHFKRSN